MRQSTNNHQNHECAISNVWNEEHRANPIYKSQEHPANYRAANSRNNGYCDKRPESICELHTYTHAHTYSQKGQQPLFSNGALGIKSPGLRTQLDFTWDVFIRPTPRNELMILHRHPRVSAPAFDFASGTVRRG